MKLCGGRGKEALYIGCIYMSTALGVFLLLMVCKYEELKEDILYLVGFK